jgi:hypothetical protein
MNEKMKRNFYTLAPRINDAIFTDGFSRKSFTLGCSLLVGCSLLGGSPFYPLNFKRSFA